MANTGTKIFGIFSAQIPDNVGETVYLEGIDNRINLVIDEHESDDSFHNIGAVSKTKKIFSADQCEDVYQKKCWDYVKAPFLYGEAELFDGEGHPDALSAAAIMRFTSRPDVEQVLVPGFSLDGGIIQRTDAQGNPTEDKEQGKNLTRVLATRIAFTLKPCCPKARAWLFNDLTKSDMPAKAPKAYLDALKKSQCNTSVFQSINSTDLKLLLKSEVLRKSVDDFLKAFTSTKCETCATPVRFFKSSPPNRCGKCNKPFNISQIWKSLNK